MLKSWGRFVAIVAVTVLLAAHIAPAQDCPGDVNGDGEVTVDEILLVVNVALQGCPQPTPSVPPTPVPTATATATPQPTLTPTPTGRFVDNADGTVTDTQTGLMWEKKSDDFGIHDKDNLYTWTVTHPQGFPNGTVFSQFLPTLNGGRFAGYSDWRLPTLEELRTLLDLSAPTPGGPLVDEAFDNGCVPGCRVTACSCTKALNYWTETGVTGRSDTAWYVLFNTGQSGTGLKTLGLHARAVRGGGG
jgi:hypothetical protein